MPVQRLLAVEMMMAVLQMAVMRKKMPEKKNQQESRDISFKRKRTKR